MRTLLRSGELRRGKLRTERKEVGRRKGAPFAGSCRKTIRRCSIELCRTGKLCRRQTGINGAWRKARGTRNKEIWLMGWVQASGGRQKNRNQLQNVIQVVIPLEDFKSGLRIIFNPVFWGSCTALFPFNFVA